MSLDSHTDSPARNGHGPRADSSLELGGMGGLVSQLNPSHKDNREDIQIIRNAVEQGWDIPPQWRQQLPRIAVQIATDDRANSSRDRLRALEVLVKMLSENVKYAVELDRINRLDAYNNDDLTDSFEFMKMVLPGGREL